MELHQDPRTADELIQSRSFQSLVEAFRTAGGEVATLKESETTAVKIRIGRTSLPIANAFAARLSRLDPKKLLQIEVVAG